MPSSKPKHAKAGATDTLSQQEQVSAVATHSLDFFAEASARAHEALGEPSPNAENVLAVVNTMASDAAVNNIADITDTQRRELRKLSEEPAIARVVTEDESGARRTYFISRATPYRSPSDGSAAASYKSAFGRLASLPIGGETEISTKSGSHTLVVLEKALLRPSTTNGEWDSLKSVIEGESFGPLTVSSFRELLRAQGIPADEADILEAALASDRAAALIVEGLRRDVITKMELRDLAVLDEFQDEIFRLPIDSRLVILGPPGTGKTTTLIKRLAQKRDLESLDEDERDAVRSSLAGTARHSESWIMFTPTNLLKQYVKEAFARENIAAPDDRIQTWDDYRREIARNRFGILRSPSGGGVFVVKDHLPSLLPATVADQRDWFTDFEGWQTQSFWTELQNHAQILASNKETAIARLGARIQDALPTNVSGLHVSAFSALGELSDDVQSLIARLKGETDAQIRSAIGAELRNDQGFLNALMEFLPSVTESDDADDTESEDEEETRQVRVGRDAAVETLTRAIRAKARSTASGRTLSKQSRNGKIIEWFGNRGLSADALRNVGLSLQVQASARRSLNPLRRFIDGVAGRYRRFRRERQTESRWYAAEGFAATDLNPLEADVIVLAVLKAGRAFLADRRTAREVDQGRHPALVSVRGLLRSQVLVDEATDFSPVQLNCMAQLCDPALQSFVACGDFNQRITEWGSRSDADLKWVFSDFEIRPVSITYRHSRQLNELARSIALLSSPDVPEAQLPQRVNNDGFDPVLATALQDSAALAAWLGQRIGEIAILTPSLPPIAVLVSAEEYVVPVANALNEVLADGNTRAVPCAFGQFGGQDNDVRVFDVQHIKGLEFEAVFFVGIDQLAERQPDLFEKYLYVGATRAAMYLGVITAGAALPVKVASLVSKFRAAWP